MQSPAAANCAGSFYRSAAVTIVLTLVFGGSLAVAQQLLSQGAVPSGAFSWLVAAIPVVIGALLLLSFVKFIHSMDELWIKVYLRSLAFSFGVAVLGLMAYPMLEMVGAPTLNSAFYSGFCVLVLIGTLFYSARKYT